MGYNNLLGFPYQYGYSSPNLNHLVEQYSFQPIQELNSELITLPSPGTPQWVRKEEYETLTMLQALSQFFSEIYPNTLSAPWIEVTYQKSDT